MLQKEYDIQHEDTNLKQQVECLLLAERIRVLLNAFSVTLKENEENPDIYILISVMREVISKYLPKDD